MHPYLLDIAGLVAVIILVALNGYFVAAEFALVTVRWTRVEQLVSQGKFGAKGVAHAIEHLTATIATTQVGVTLSSLALGWIGESRVAHLLEPLFRGIHTPWGGALTHG